MPVAIHRNSDCSGPKVDSVRWSKVLSFVCSSLSAGSRLYFSRIKRCVRYCTNGGMFIRTEITLFASHGKKPGESKTHASERISAMPVGSGPVSSELFDFDFGEPPDALRFFLLEVEGDAASGSIWATSCCCAATPPNARACRYHDTLPPVLKPTRMTFSLQEFLGVDDGVSNVFHEIFHDLHLK